MSINPEIDDVIYTGFLFFRSADVFSQLHWHGTDIGRNLPASDAFSDLVKGFEELIIALRLGPLTIGTDQGANKPGVVANELRRASCLLGVVG